MRKETALALCCGFILSAGFIACSGGDPPDDTGTPDAGTTKPDAGTTPDAGTPKLAPGSACESDDQCQGPSATCVTSLPGGYCTKDCVVASQCPNGSKCQDFGGTSTCVASCNSDDDCRKADGYYCEPEGKYCISAKYVPTNEGGNAVGEPCTSPDDCEGAVCLPEKTQSGLETGYAGGYCMASCVDGRPESCPEGATCLNGYCRTSCTKNDDCRGAPYACIDGTCRLDPDTVALGGACTKAADCAKGASCITEDESAGTFPGGACTLIDDCNATTGTGCGQGGTCVELLDPSSGGVAAVPTCVQKCADDAGCREGYKCDTTLHACLRPVAADFSKVKLGATCTANTDCDAVEGAGGICLKGDQFPGGYCVAPGCERKPADQGGDTCASAGGSCWILGFTNQRECIKDCQAVAECRGDEGYICDDDKTCWFYPPDQGG